MSVVARGFVLLAMLAVGLTFSPAGHASPIFQWDAAVVSSASQKLGPWSQSRALHWLRHQPGVASAAVGRDGQTVSIRFTDGLRGAVLPRTATLARLSLPSVRLGARPRLRPHQTPGGRAIILEPVATELGLGPNAGDIEVSDLKAAGYTVDQLYDTQVTVSAMLTLPRYNVVYMHTHSGVDPNGDGLLATGQYAQPDATVQPYLNDGTVEITGVAGTGQTYYGISTRFVTIHMGIFPAGSFLFINGCALSTTNFEPALLQHGAGAVISWNNEVTAQVGYISSAGVFYYMSSKGDSIATAVQQVTADGNGTSTYNNQPATLGFQGDGSITLQSAAAGGVQRLRLRLRPQPA